MLEVKFEGDAHVRCFSIFIVDFKQVFVLWILLKETKESYVQNCWKAH